MTPSSQLGQLGASMTGRERVALTKPLEPFLEFPKIPRLNREVVVSEKLDGTNASVYITEAGTIHAASKSKWIDEADDNHGFAKWVAEHAQELMALGPGYHRGEWHGSGINKNRNRLPDKRWALFNTTRWTTDTPPPACCSVVPILYRGPFDTTILNGLLSTMREQGSRAYPGTPGEGIIIFHTASTQFWKATTERDTEWKGKPA